MRKINIFIFIIVQIIVNSSSIFAQKNIDFSKNILTIGVFEPEDCGLVNARPRGEKLPEDEISKTVKEHIGAQQMGTGFVYSYNGIKYIITCEHVVFKAGKIMGYNSSYDKSYELELLNGDTFFDVAVLKFKNPNDARQFESIQFETNLPNENDKVHSFGYWDLNGTQTSFSGKVLENDYKVDHRSLPISKMGFIKSTAKLPKGYSGGILSNERGKVLGMNTMRGNKDAKYYALQSKIVKRIIENVIDNGSVQRAFLGIQFSQNIKGGAVILPFRLKNEEKKDCILCRKIIWKIQQKQ